MNEVFLMGKVISEVKFDFVINSKKIKSIAKFKVETVNKQIIDIVGYNETADYIYRKIDIGNVVFINGTLAKNGVIIKTIQK